jgi:UDP-GlcNAc:undecaprenyl-phosphate GlcNAc-1-phosphate transferase
MNLIILFIFSLLTTYLSLFLGRKIKIIDNPSSEKIHKVPVPRTGGLGIFLTFLLGIILFPDVLAPYEVAFLICIFLIGFIDDMISIPQKIKFSIEILLGIVMGIISSWHFTGVYLLDILFATFYIVGSINALNEIDGMDGLAGGVVLISSLFLSYWIKDITPVIAVAVLGFLFFNFHPAKIFMGDGGSLFLGAFVGLMSLKVLNSHPNLSTLIALIFVYSVPIYDSALTVIRRFLSGKSIFIPDLGHFYNKLYNITRNYVGTVLIIYSFAIILGIIGIWLYSLTPILSLVLGGLIWIILLYLGYSLGFLEG